MHHFIQATHRIHIYQRYLHITVQRRQFVERDVYNLLSSKSSLYLLPNEKDTKINAVEHVPTFARKENNKSRYKIIESEHISLSLRSAKLVIGCNLKNICKTLWNTCGMREFLKSGGRIWDLNYAQYFLSAQRSTSLETVLLDLETPSTGMHLKSQQEKFRDLEKLASDMMLQCIKHYQFDIVWHRMDTILWTIEMEINGIYVDKEFLGKRRILLHCKLKEIENEMSQICNKWLSIKCAPNTEVQYPWHSLRFLKSLYFGGEYVDVKMMSLGEVQKVESSIAKMYVPLPYMIHTFPCAADRDEICLSLLSEWNQQCCAYNDGLPLTYKRIRSCDNSIWQFVHDKTGFFADVVLSCAKKQCTLSKLLLSYQKTLHTIEVLLKGDSMQENIPKGLFGFIQPKTSCLHAEICCQATTTSRLQASKPNVFGIPKDKVVRELFRSRFGKNGHMVEVDFSQLEVRVAALLSQDKRMISMIHKEVDFHTLRVTTLKPSLTYEDVEKCTKVERDPELIQLRANAKKFSFQRLYGASAKSISASTGLSLQEVEVLIKGEKKMFPDLDRFYSTVKRAVQENYSKNLLTSAGEIKKLYGYYQLPSGTRLAFEKQCESHNLSNKVVVQSHFSDTQMRNHPIQSFAAEIVQLAMGRLWRHFLHFDNYNNRALIVNAVHDSVWVDSSIDVLSTVCRDVQLILEKCWTEVAPLFVSTRNLMPVPFPVTVQHGPSMAL